MPLQRKVKLLYLGSAGIDMDQGPVSSSTDTEEYQFQDKYRIIGAHILVHMDVDSAGSFDEGDAYTLGVISLSGINPIDGVNFKDGVFVTKFCKVHVEEFTAGACMNGQMVGENTVMFPEGYEVDVDEHDKVYVHGSGINRMGAAAGDMSASIRGFLYVVER